LLHDSFRYESREHLTELLTELNDLWARYLDGPIKSPDGIQVFLFREGLAEVRQKASKNLLVDVVTIYDGTIRRILFSKELLDASRGIGLIYDAGTLQELCE